MNFSLSSALGWFGWQFLTRGSVPREDSEGIIKFLLELALLGLGQMFGVDFSLGSSMGPWSYLLTPPLTVLLVKWSGLGTFSLQLRNPSLGSRFQSLALQVSRLGAEALLGRFQNTSRQLSLSHFWSQKHSCTSSPKNSGVQTDLGAAPPSCCQGCFTFL